MRVDVQQQQTDARLLEAYREYVQALRLRQAKYAYALPFFLVPAAMALDYFVYPEILGALFRSRMWCNVAIVPCWWLLFTRYGRPWLGFLGNAWLLAPMFAISWMIYATEGANSPYYAGLNLVMLAATLLTTYRAPQAIAFCGTVIGCYALACLLHAVAPPAEPLRKSVLVDGSLLVNNLYFLSATGCVCVAACHFQSQRRFADFQLRHELDVNNGELETTIRKLQETEVQLVQSEKMNALGKLSAGLLHEVNNPLNFSFMALQVAEQQAAGDAELQETLGDLQQGMDRIKSVIADLRAFAYPSRPGDAERFELAEALTTALRLTAHEVKDVPVEQRGVAGVVGVGGKSQIVHVLMNLLINAAHAVSAPNLGRAPHVTVECRSLAGGGRMEVAVYDNGTGVAPENLPKLLDPFFTTKDPGKGTGLGLSICHTIVKNHGGTIRITSEQGQWTRVAFDWPAAGVTTQHASEAEVGAEPEAEVCA